VCPDSADCMTPPGLWDNQIGDAGVVEFAKALMANSIPERAAPIASIVGND